MTPFILYYQREREREREQLYLCVRKEDGRLTTVCSRWNKKWKVLRLVWKQIFSTIQRLGLTSHELRVTGNQYIGKNTSHGQVPQATLTIRQGNIRCDLCWKFMTEISVYNTNKSTPIFEIWKPSQACDSQRIPNAVVAGNKYERGNMKHDCACACACALS